MSYVAKLKVLGQEREVLNAEVSYHRTTDHKTGWLGADPQGGTIRLKVLSSYHDDALLRWITYAEENELCQLAKDGVRGTKYRKVESPDKLNSGMKTKWEKCPWDRIPQKGIMTDKPIIKTRTKNFKDSERLAIKGINYHWGRNDGHFAAKHIQLPGIRHEVCTNAVITDTDTMDDVRLIFNTNNNWVCSGNPGTVEGIISAVGNLVSREAICYNVGYVKSDIWSYRNVEDEDIVFKEIAAHEIGHAILKACWGIFYSYEHKGTVNVFTQKSNPLAKEHPAISEIDIMPYYTGWLNHNQKKRMVASEKDVASLIWISKL